MSLTLAQADAATVLADALQIYKEQTGVTLAPADPRRLHIQTLLLFLAQHRALIDFAGKQSMLRYVTSLWIRELAKLWKEDLLPAKPSTCTVRFHLEVSGTQTIAAGKRVTDGTSLWAVTTATTGTGAYIDCPVACTVNGAASNLVAVGQIATLVDDIPNVSSVESTTETVSGRDIEGTEAFRARLRSVPESRSTCGPRLAYEAQALAASSSVADAAALGPEDGDDMAGYPPAPGEVWILVIEGTRDADDNVTSTIPDPGGGLLTTVHDACSEETVRPLTDHVVVKAPEFIDFDVDVTYYIARSRSAQATEIIAAVEAAHAAYKLAQSKIGRDINPDDMRSRFVVAGAKRCAVTSPSFTVLYRDQCSRLVYDTLNYGGIEDD